jgi:hypothetical protein
MVRLQAAGRAVAGQRALVDAHDAVGGGGGVGVVRDHHDGRAAALHQQAQQREHLFAAAPIEVAGGLVAQQQAGARDDGARDGHPLLLAAGHHLRPMSQAVRQPDQLEGRARACPALGGARAAEREGQRHVVERAQHRDQVVELEHEADAAGAPVGELGVRHAVERPAVDAHLAGVGPVEAAHQVEQAGLARAARPHDGDELAAPDGHAQVVEHRHERRAAAVGLDQADEVDRWLIVFHD